MLRSIDQSALQTPRSASSYLETSQSGSISPVFHPSERLAPKITSFSNGFQLCATALQAGCRWFETDTGHYTLLSILREQEIGEFFSINLVGASQGGFHCGGYF